MTKQNAADMHPTNIIHTPPVLHLLESVNSSLWIFLEVFGNCNVGAFALARDKTGQLHTLYHKPHIINTKLGKKAECYIQYTLIGNKTETNAKTKPPNWIHYIRNWIHSKRNWIHSNGIESTLNGIESTLIGIEFTQTESNGRIKNQHTANKLTFSRNCRWSPSAYEPSSAQGCNSSRAASPSRACATACSDASSHPRPCPIRGKVMTKSERIGGIKHGITSCSGINCIIKRGQTKSKLASTPIDGIRKRHPPIPFAP